MAENRKYYFLKLKEDFFEQDTIVLLESLKDGILYSNILMKMYKNHLATMEMWKKADMKKEQGTGKGYSYNGNFKEGESL